MKNVWFLYPSTKILNRKYILSYHKNKKMLQQPYYIFSLVLQNKVIIIWLKDQCSRDITLLPLYPVPGIWQFRQTPGIFNKKPWIFNMFSIKISIWDIKCIKKIKYFCFYQNFFFWIQYYSNFTVSSQCFYTI